MDKADKKKAVFTAILERVSRLEDAVREHQTEVCIAHESLRPVNKERQDDLAYCVVTERKALMSLLADAYFLEE